MAKKIFLETNGCISRSLDLKRLHDYFKENGCVIVKRPEDADDIVFLGCSAVRIEEDWSFKRIGELQKHQRNLIVGGCIKDMAGQRIPDNLKDTALSTSGLAQIDTLFPAFGTKFNAIPDANVGMKRNLRHYFVENILRMTNFRPSFLKKFIQYYEMRVKPHFILRAARGCQGEYCTYCTIWKAVGPFQSKPIEECLAELERAPRRKIERIVLVADNLGAYGTDFGKGFPDLLHAIVERFPQARFLIEELHPRWFLKYREEMGKLARAGKIIGLHIPIQSGSDRVLKLMNRHYVTADVVSALKELKEQDPKLKLFTDIIVGFPSEGDDDFKLTLKAIREMGFYSLAYHEYAKKRDLPHLTEVPKQVVKRRVNELTAYLWKNGIGGAPF